MNSKLIFYKYRFFLFYILIGIASLFFELFIYNVLKEYISNKIFVSITSITASIIFSFWFNVRYNFKISKAKRNRALIYFVFISFSSYLLQLIITEKFRIHYDYEIVRIFTSGSLFWIAYIFHRRFSFRDYKKVGVAIYANGIDDLKTIHKNVGDYPDFIHVDIVDKTFNEKANQVITYKTEVIKAYWHNKFIEAHIMSKTPSKWINKIGENVDRIFIHSKLDENLVEILKLINSKKCEVGLVIHNTQDLKVYDKFKEYINSILVLSIANPGYSGQSFDLESINLIESINKLKTRNLISLTVDGGVNQKNIALIKSENVVSGSYVLNAENPIKNIMILQTTGQYESI
jgi:ribulose-phosphate 3-epimerase